MSIRKRMAEELRADCLDIACEPVCLWCKAGNREPRGLCRGSDCRRPGRCSNGLPEKRIPQASTHIGQDMKRDSGAAPPTSRPPRGKRPPRFTQSFARNTHTVRRVDKTRIRHLRQ
jgi:hypothetical protein